MRVVSSAGLKAAKLKFDVCQFAILAMVVIGLAKRALSQRQGGGTDFLPWVQYSNITNATEYCASKPLTMRTLSS